MSVWLVLVVGAFVVAAVGWQIGPRLPRALQWLSRRAPLLAGAGAFLIAVLLTVVIGRLWTVEWFRSGDEWIYGQVIDARNDAMTEVMGIVTDMGSVGATMMAAVAGGLLVGYRTSEWRVAAALPLGLMAAYVGQRLVEATNARALPEAASSIGEAGTYPSGGVMRVLVLAGLCAIVLARRWGRDRDWQVLVTGAFVLVWLEGCSRLFLGRHWPVDLLGGVTLGVGAIAAVALPLIYSGAAPSPQRRLT